jgi:hypothetical protein
MATLAGRLLIADSAPVGNPGSALSNSLPAKARQPAMLVGGISPAAPECQPPP